MIKSNCHNNKKWFTIAEVIIAVLLLWIVFLWIIKAFNETFWILWYIWDSINWTYVLRNSVEDVLSIRNDLVDKYWKKWWENFAQSYWSGTYVFKEDVLWNMTLSWITNTFKNYEWPLDKYGKPTTDKKWTHFYRKIDISDVNNNFYLQKITRYSSGELRLSFSKDIYNKKNILLTTSFDNKDWNKIKVESNFWWELYNIDWTWPNNCFPLVDCAFLNNLNNSKLYKYSQIFNYNWVTVWDWNKFTVTNEKTWEKFEYVFDNNWIETSTWKIISFSGDTDKAIYELCSELNKLDILNCRYNYLIKDNFYQKVLWSYKEFSSIDFWSWFSFSFSWTNTIKIIPWVWNNIQEKNVNQYINPSYDLRYSKDEFKLKDDKSDMTAGEWVKIPNKPVSWSNEEIWFPSLLQVKITIYLFDWVKFVEENSVDFYIWDIYRDNFNTNKNLWSS